MSLLFFGYVMVVTELSALPATFDFQENYKQFIHIDAKQDSLLQALWLTKLSKKHPERLFVVVCQTQHLLNQLETELIFFGVTAKVFADWETLVYDRLSPHQDIVSERIELLSHMPTSGILLVAVQTLMQRVAPPSWLLGQHFEVVVGQSFEIERQKTTFVQAGYQLVDTVYSSGEFAVRGGVFDVFLMGQPLPLRLELFDDEIESIRFFDPDTQRTLTKEQLATVAKENLTSQSFPSSAKIDCFSVLPAKEFPFATAKQTFRQNFATVFNEASHRKSEMYQEVMADIAPAGIEYYQPLFFEPDQWQTGTLFAYLPSDSVFVMPENLPEIHEELWRKIDERYQNWRHDPNNPIVEPSLLYLNTTCFFGQLKPFAKIVLSHVAHHHSLVSHRSFETLTIDHRAAEPLQRLLDFIATQNHVLIVAESTGRREIVLELLKDKLNVTVFASFEQFLTNKDNHVGVGLTVAPIDRGLWLADDGLCIISESQIFGRQIIQARNRKQNSLSQAFLVKSVTELNEGSLVVHIEHGIGRYQGLVVLDVGEGDQEFLHLTYADDASIYVPITQLALIGRYSGVDSHNVPLSKIGSGKWDKARQKTLSEIYDVAAELLNVQARRNAKQGISFEIDMAQYELFASGFEFEETTDQRAAIESVIFDMKQSKPMDRLICGDVGFGKTEVAMRAAFIAVQAGYQVAVLVPTTLLAGQHEDSFRSRFADWPVRIESLSRFGSGKHQKNVLLELAEGKVDIVIGTHKLLQSDVVFQRLGLMIVDEEHRFGVRHKQAIKKIQADIDSLSMTATPIPRTLNMALSGMQDISIIATPPARRLAVKTFVMEKSNMAMTEAILREILRGGQVYFLHNDVASIDSMAETLQNLVAEARIGVAHGQMPERALSAVMSEFYHKKTNILVASTIIETGIDVPNANTIIINRADKFGLAQLHQLRGRVGRSHHQAYCYLLVPSIKGLSIDAKKRLDAISRANTLGSGFMLASEDLEIRGAGEILGKEQSGNIQTIGFGLYMDMLERATKAIKAGHTPSLATPLDLVSDINIHASALIPDEYLGDVHERLVLYKRISNVEDIETLDEIKSEMIDRFGVMPQALLQLFLVHRIRILTKPLGIVKVDISERALSIEFKPNAPIDGMAIITLIQSDDSYRMQSPTTLKQTFKDNKQVNERIEIVIKLLAYFKRHLLA